MKYQIVESAALENWSVEMAKSTNTNANVNWFVLNFEESNKILKNLKKKEEKRRTILGTFEIVFDSCGGI